MKKICTSPSVYGECYVPCVLVNNYRTNVGFRIANLIHILDGRNKVKYLEFFSEHVLERVDNGEIIVDVKEMNTETGDISKKVKRIDMNIFLRGAIGPRLRWWVGANQLAEANKVNLNVDRVEDTVRPQGVDQLRMICTDLKFNKLNASSFVIRDPGIDFEESNDIPDLIAGTFTKSGDKLDLTLFYEYLGDIINDVWFFSKLLMITANWCSLKIGDITIIGINDDCGNFDTNVEFTDSNSLIYRINEVGYNPVDFFDDFEWLANIFDNLMCMFNKQTYEIKEVDYETMLGMVERTIEGRIKTEFIRDLIYGLLVWILVNKCDSYGEEHIVDYMGKIKTRIKYEIAHMITYVGAPVLVANAADSILGELCPP